jgi:hypothetical protein
LVAEFHFGQWRLVQLPLVLVGGGNLSFDSGDLLRDLSSSIPFPASNFDLMLLERVDLLSGEMEDDRVGRKGVVSVLPDLDIVVGGN